MTIGTTEDMIVVGVFVSTVVIAATVEMIAVTAGVVNGAALAAIATIGTRKAIYRCEDVGTVALDRETQGRGRDDRQRGRARAHRNAR